MPKLNKILNTKTPQLAVVIFIIWFCSLLVLSQVYFCNYLPKSCGITAYLSMLGQWDGQNFLSIIYHGYDLIVLFAFFPLFPGLIKVISLFLPFGELANGLILNWIAMGIGMYFFYKLLEMDYQRKDVIFIILMLLVFPYSFFFITFYSEALFFCLSILSLFFYRKQKFGISVFFLFLLTITRMAGIALVLAIILEQIRLKKNPVLFLLPFLGILGYVFYAFLQTGSLLALINAEENWQRLVVYPGFSIFNSLNVLLTQGVSFGNYGVAIDLILVLVVLILIIRSYKFLPKIYWFYTLFSVLIPLSTSTFLSFPRFLIVIFPLFIAFFRMSSTVVQVIFVVIAFILQQIMFWSFLQGGWIA